MLNPSTAWGEPPSTPPRPPSGGRRSNPRPPSGSNYLSRKPALSLDLGFNKLSTLDEIPERPAFVTISRRMHDFQWEKVLGVHKIVPGAERVLKSVRLNNNELDSVAGLDTFLFQQLGRNLMYERQNAKLRAEYTSMTEYQRSGTEMTVVSLKERLAVLAEHNAASQAQWLKADIVSQIEWLDLGFNALSTVEESLLRFSSVTSLTLTGNNICELADVQQLQRLPRLRTLVLFGNPVADQPG
jgi:hypothetical protein